MENTGKFTLVNTYLKDVVVFSVYQNNRRVGLAVLKYSENAIWLDRLQLEGNDSTMTVLAIIFHEITLECNTNGKVAFIPYPYWGFKYKSFLPETWNTYKVFRRWQEWE